MKTEEKTGKLEGLVALGAAGCVCDHGVCCGAAGPMWDLTGRTHKSRDRSVKGRLGTFKLAMAT